MSTSGPFDGVDEIRIETSGAFWNCLGLGDGEGARIRELAPSLSSLIERSREARRLAYAPYSNFHVGSALLMDGELFSGCNVENASYGGTLCAERTAIATAVAAGKRKLDLIAVSTGAAPGTPPGQRSPCGLCRQVMGEFADGQTLVLLDAGDEGGKILAEVIAFDRLFPWRFRLGG